LGAKPARRGATGTANTRARVRRHRPMRPRRLSAPTAAVLWAPRARMMRCAQKPPWRRASPPGGRRQRQTRELRARPRRRDRRRRPTGVPPAAEPAEAAAASVCQLLLGASAPLEGRGRLHALLGSIDRDAPAVTLLFGAQGREWDGDFLVADAEEAPDVDDGGGGLAVGSDQDVADCAEVLAGGIIDVVIGEFVAGGANRAPIILRPRQ